MKYLILIASILTTTASQALYIEIDVMKMSQKVHIPVHASEQEAADYVIAQTQTLLGPDISVMILSPAAQFTYEEKRYLDAISRKIAERSQHCYWSEKSEAHFLSSQHETEMHNLESETAEQALLQLKSRLTPQYSSDKEIRNQTPLSQSTKELSIQRGALDTLELDAISISNSPLIETSHAMGNTQNTKHSDHKNHSTPKHQRVIILRTIPTLNPFHDPELVTPPQMSSLGTANVPQAEIFFLDETKDWLLDYTDVQSYFLMILILLILAHLTDMNLRQEKQLKKVAVFSEV